MPEKPVPLTKEGLARLEAKRHRAARCHQDEEARQRQEEIGERPPQERPRKNSADRRANQGAGAGLSVGTADEGAGAAADQGAQAG